MKQTHKKVIQALTELVDKPLVFKSSDSYYWSPADSTVFYQDSDASEVGIWTLLHEASHGILGHKNYNSDYELLLMENDAWQEAKKIAQKLKIDIDEDHIQDCLDSYRDWHYKRSQCVNCSVGGIQLNQKTYTCVFCSSTWNVSKERFCRPYRLKTT